MVAGDFVDADASRLAQFQVAAHGFEIEFARDADQVVGTAVAVRRNFLDGRVERAVAEFA
jgi:hypothetical protein